MTIFKIFEVVLFYSPWHKYLYLQGHVMTLPTRVIGENKICISNIFLNTKARWLVLFNNSKNANDFLPRIGIESPTIGWRSMLSSKNIWVHSWIKSHVVLFVTLFANVLFPTQKVPPMTSSIMGKNAVSSFSSIVIFQDIIHNDILLKSVFV